MASQFSDHRKGHSAQQVHRNATKAKSTSVAIGKDATNVGTAAISSRPSSPSGYRGYRKDPWVSKGKGYSSPALIPQPRDGAVAGPESAPLDPDDHIEYPEYVTVRQESLAEIARQEGTTAAILLQLNADDDPKLRIDSVLLKDTHIRLPANPWEFTGHPWLATEWERKLENGSTMPCRITSWCRADGLEPAMWHVQHQDGDTEDLYQEQVHTMLLPVHTAEVSESVKNKLKNGWVPEGWQLEEKQRQQAEGGKVHVDKYWTDPKGNTFRSMVGVERALNAAEQHDSASSRKRQRKAPQATGVEKSHEARGCNVRTETSRVGPSRQTVKGSAAPSALLASPAKPAPAMSIKTPNCNRRNHHSGCRCHCKNNKTTMQQPLLEGHSAASHLDACIDRSISELVTIKERFSEGTISHALAAQMCRDVSKALDTNSRKLQAATAPMPVPQSAIAAHVCPQIAQPDNQEISLFRSAKSATGFKYVEQSSDGTYKARWKGTTIKSGCKRPEEAAVAYAEKYFAMNPGLNSTQPANCGACHSSGVLSRKGGTRTQLSPHKPRAGKLVCHVALPAGMPCGLFEGESRRIASGTLGKQIHPDISLETAAREKLAEDCWRECKANGLTFQREWAQQSGFVALTVDDAQQPVLVSILCLQVRHSEAEILRLTTVKEHQRQGYATILLAVVKELLCNRQPVASGGSVKIKADVLQDQVEFYCGTTAGFQEAKQCAQGPKGTLPVCAVVDAHMAGMYIAASMKRPRLVPTHLPVGAKVQVRDTSHSCQRLWKANIAAIVDGEYRVRYENTDEGTETHHADRSCIRRMNG